MRTTATVLVLAIAVAAHFGYGDGSRRAPGSPDEPPPESGPCPCKRGRLVRQSNGRYQCYECGRNLRRLPETR